MVLKSGGMEQTFPSLPPSPLLSPGQDEPRILFPCSRRGWANLTTWIYLKIVKHSNELKLIAGQAAGHRQIIPPGNKLLIIQKLSLQIITHMQSSDILLVIGYHSSCPITLDFFCLSPSRSGKITTGHCVFMPLQVQSCGKEFRFAAHCLHCIQRHRLRTSTAWRCSLTRALGAKPRTSHRQLGTRDVSLALFKTGQSEGSLCLALSLLLSVSHYLYIYAKKMSLKLKCPDFRKWSNSDSSHIQIYTILVCPQQLDIGVCT